MEFEELKQAIDGLCAYDLGATDSGIKDEALRQRVRDYVRSLPNDEARVVLSRVVRESCLTDEAIEAGYGWEDAMELCRWIESDFSA